MLYVTDFFIHVTLGHRRIYNLPRYWPAQRTKAERLGFFNEPNEDFDAVGQLLVRA